MHALGYYAFMYAACAALRIGPIFVSATKNDSSIHSVRSVPFRSVPGFSTTLWWCFHEWIIWLHTQNTNSAYGVLNRYQAKFYYIVIWVSANKACVICSVLTNVRAIVHKQKSPVIIERIDYNNFVSIMKPKFHSVNLCHENIKRQKLSKPRRNLDV